MLKPQPIPQGLITLSEWNIIVLEVGDQIIEKFIGFESSRGTYRVSSQILKYNEKNNTGSTVSGSEYCLLGIAGKLHPQAQSVFDTLATAPDIKASLKYPHHYKH